MKKTIGSSFCAVEMIYYAALLLVVVVVILLLPSMQYYSNAVDPVFVIESKGNFGAILSSNEDDNTDEIVTKEGETFTLKLTAFGGKVEKVSPSSVTEFLDYSIKGEEGQNLEVRNINVYDNVVSIDMVASKEGNYQITFSKRGIKNTEGESSAPSNTVWVQVKND